MNNKDLENTQKKPLPEPAPPLTDLPNVVSDADGKLIKGGPDAHPWVPKSQT